MPDPGAFDEDSEFGQLVTSVKTLFEEALQQQSPPASGEEDSTASAALQARGLRLGDRVLVGGVKVTIFIIRSDQLMVTR